MNKEAKQKYKEELMKDAQRIMEEVNSDPSLKNVTAPPEIREKLFAAIRAKEMESTKERLSDEEKELIRLGAIYKRKRKNKKYLVLAAAMMLALALGITSFGGAEKVFEMFKRDILGREQVQVNSKQGVIPVEDLNEEEAYEEIEEKFGFYPVKLDYLPEGVAFWETELDEQIPRIYMFYGKDEEIKISYIIRPNYRNSSWEKILKMN